MDYTNTDVADYLRDMAQLLNFDGNERGVAMLLHAADVIEKFAEVE